VLRSCRKGCNTTNRHTTLFTLRTERTRMGQQCSRQALETTAIVSSSARESNPRFLKKQGKGRTGADAATAAAQASAGGTNYGSSGTISTKGIARTDPALFSLQQQSIAHYNNTESNTNFGQWHLLYKHQQRSARDSGSVTRRRSRQQPSAVGTAILASHFDNETTSTTTAAEDSAFTEAGRRSRRNSYLCGAMAGFRIIDAAE
jgi:hypothetical protein